jgi:protoporphyrinogen/coproporphyrinogen III oxidase
MKKKIQIIGGGFSGLSLAYFFQKKGFSVRLVEKSDRLGGMISTKKLPQGLAETAANAVLSNLIVEEVAKDIGIELIPTLPSAKKRFIFRDFPRKWPISLLDSVFLFFYVLPKFLFRRKSMAPFPQETISDWGKRNLGNKITEFLLIPALSGIYAGDPKVLSASLILGRFFRLETLPKGKWQGSVAPKGGMGDWIDGFHQYLVKGETEFAKVPDFLLPTIFAIPPWDIVKNYSEHLPRLNPILNRIEPLPLVTATLFFPSRAKALEGFGCLFPRSQNIRALGLLCNGYIFSGRTKDSVSETWIHGGALDREVLKLSDHQLIESIQMDRFKLFQSPVEPIHWEICRWPKAIPHYNLSLEHALDELKYENFREGKFFLFGTYLGDLGLARLLPRAKRFVEEF